MILPNKTTATEITAGLFSFYLALRTIFYLLLSGTEQHSKLFFSKQWKQTEPYKELTFRCSD